MKQIYSFLLGLVIAVTLTAAAQTSGILTAKPATPKSVLVKAFRARLLIEDEVRDFILNKTREGYIVKSVAMTEDETYSKAVVVMEKY